MGTVICRHGYCARCDQANRPWKGALFLAYGTYRGGYFLKEATHNGTRGYTPHLFILNQVTGSGICIVSTVCSMYGCCVEYRHSKQDHKMVYGVIPDRWETIYLSIADWNALTAFKRQKEYQI